MGVVHQQNGLHRGKQESGSKLTTVF